MTKKNYGKDSQEYLEKKEYYSRFLTIYGKNAVLEALDDKSIDIAKIHIAQNRKPDFIKKITEKAGKRDVEVNLTTIEKVNRISKNSRQDQGIAADIRLENYITVEDFLKEKTSYKLLALDGITTPGNVGMIIRSAAAGGMDGIILPEQGCCKLNPLVIKASVGTVFLTNILKCNYLADALMLAKKDGAVISSLDVNAHGSIFDYKPAGKEIFVLGSESSGISKPVRKLTDNSLFIPMADGIESLNVAMAATLISYALQYNYGK